MGRILAAMGLTALLGGCATIVEGTTQDLFLSVTPERADCAGYQNGRVGYEDGQVVGTYDRATSRMRVGKSRYDLTIVCKADGYRDKTVVLESTASGWGIAGALILDFGIVDYATGALNKYDGTITIVMEPT